MKPLITVVMFADKRTDYTELAAKSLFEKVHYDGPLQYVYHEDYCEINDTEENRKERMLWAAKAGFDTYISPAKKLGISGSVQNFWSKHGGDLVFHTENDFLFLEGVDLGVLADAYDSIKDASQIALPRQPWYSHEKGMNLNSNELILAQKGEFYRFNGKHFMHAPSLYGKRAIELYKHYSEAQHFLTMRRKNLFTYYMGGPDAYPTVWHIGKISSKFNYTKE